MFLSSPSRNFDLKKINKALFLEIYFKMFPALTVFGLGSALACSNVRHVAAKESKYPIYAEDSLMAKKQHGTCIARAQRVRFYMGHQKNF